jgi:hypothetical protein
MDSDRGLQFQVFLDPPENLHTLLVVAGVRDKLALLRDPRGHDVDMVMLAVGVTDKEVGAVGEAQSIQVSAGGLPPLLIGEDLARSKVE